MTITLDGLKAEQAELADIYRRELAEARELLAKALEERGPDYVYEEKIRGGGCMYQTYDESIIGLNSEGYPEFRGKVEYAEQCTGPACIVGHVMYGKAVDPLRIRAQEGRDAATVLQVLGVFEHRAVAHALDAAQRAQDTGSTWGEAVTAFESYIGGYEQNCRVRGVEAGALSNATIF